MTYFHISLHSTRHNDKAETWFMTTKLHKYSVRSLKHLWQRLQLRFLFKVWCNKHCAFAFGCFLPSFSMPVKVGRGGTVCGWAFLIFFQRCLTGFRSGLLLGHCIVLSVCLGLLSYWTRFHSGFLYFAAFSLSSLLNHSTKYCFFKLFWSWNISIVLSKNIIVTKITHLFLWPVVVLCSK